MSFEPEEQKFGSDQDPPLNEEAFELSPGGIILPSHFAHLHLPHKPVPVEETLAELQSVFKQVWSRELSCQPLEWGVDKPWWGQLDVTLLSVQDFVGGDLKQAQLIVSDQIVPYYYLSVGQEDLDPLREIVQSVGEVEMPDNETDAFTTRELMLAMPKVADRYSLFCERVQVAFSA